jgi:hypothetical protein
MTVLDQVDPTTWRVNVTYRDTEEGATCPSPLDCTEVIPAGHKLTFRASLIRNSVSTNMKGYNYEINFPLSMVSSLFEDHPHFVVRPWFFADKGQIVELDVMSSDPVVGRRVIEVYIPPSATENPQPEYDVLLGFDLNGDVMPPMAQALDYEFSEIGRAKEAVVVGHGNFSYTEHADRVNMLTPVSADRTVCE